MTYHRFTSGDQCDNGCGYMMFADDADRLGGYGANHWTFDGVGAIPVADLIDAAREAGFEAAFYAADALAPTDIVNSANAWDDMGAVAWIWENVCETRGWMAIATDDGAIVFDPAMVVRAL